MPISRTGTISESRPHDLRAKIRCHRQPSPTDQWRGSADSHRKCRWAKTANCIGITEAGGAREKRSRRPRAHNPFAIWRPRSPNQPHKTQAPRHPATGGRACVALTSALEESDVSRPPGQGRPPPFHGRRGRRGVRQASASKANVSRPRPAGSDQGDRITQRIPVRLACRHPCIVDGRAHRAIRRRIGAFIAYTGNQDSIFARSAHWAMAAATNGSEFLRCSAPRTR
jgi:hypothetical protein